MLKFIPLQAKRVLDVGCHTGAFGKAIKDKCGAEVWGVEPDHNTAAAASKSLDRVFNAYFCEDLDLPDRYFDVIVFNDVLEHMPDPWEALKLSVRKLTVDGSVIISIPNLRHIDNLVHIMRERDFNYEKLGIRDKTHLRFFTQKSAPRLFDDSGLAIVHMEGINEECYPSLLRSIAFKVFKNYLDDTRHVQFAIVAKPLGSIVAT
jgi:2-polyprenyl-3-methyl-5-hydroxy-6-metoxy-1,4-benzoquinol methylase